MPNRDVKQPQNNRLLIRMLHDFDGGHAGISANEYKPEEDLGLPHQVVNRQPVPPLQLNDLSSTDAPSSWQARIYVVSSILSIPRTLVYRQGSSC